MARIGASGNAGPGLRKDPLSWPEILSWGGLKTWKGQHNWAVFEKGLSGRSGFGHESWFPVAAGSAFTRFWPAPLKPYTSPWIPSLTGATQPKPTGSTDLNAVHYTRSVAAISWIYLKTGQGEGSGGPIAGFAGWFRLKMSFTRTWNSNLQNKIWAVILFEETLALTFSWGVNQVGMSQLK